MPCTHKSKKGRLVSNSAMSRFTLGGRPKWALLLPCALAAGLVWLLGPAGTRVEAEQQAPVPEAAAACSACHADATASWAASVHRRTVGAPQISESKQACAACHPRTTEHLADLSDEGKRPSLRDLSSDQVAEICLGCHQGGKQTMWKLSAHARTKDACLACHDPHGGEGEYMLKAEETALCAKCHPGPISEGELPSHHPIQEGKMTCTDCHNAHGDERGNLPEVSTGEMCYKCHAEKAGPFQAEHPPVTEDCTICHRPHGSPVDNLLVQDQPILCLQCHPGHSDSHRTPIVPTSPDNPDGLEGINGFYGKCTSCHSRIHGTDLMSGSGNPTFMPGGAPSTSATSVRSLGVSASEGLWGFSDMDLGRIDEEGNPNYVREYDGRNYDILNTVLSLEKYAGDGDLHVDVVDLPRGDQDIDIRYGTPKLSAKARISGLTHRLGRYDDTTDAIIAGQNGGTNRVNTTDLAEGQNDHQIHRTVIDLEVAARCSKMPQAKWLLNMWQEREHGSRQFLFLDRCTSCHKIQTTEPIDRVTTITQGGVQVDLPKASLRYLRGQQEFSNLAPEGFYNFSGVSRVFRGVAPLFGVAPTETTTNDLLGSAALGQRASMTALWRTKDRDNELGGGRVSLRSTGGGATYALSRNLYLQGSHFARGSDVKDVPEGVSRDRDTTRVGLRYTGIPKATWSLELAKEKVTRESERTFVPEESNSNIWSSAFTYSPRSRLSLQLRYRGTQTEHRDFYDPAEAPTHFAARLSGPPTEGSLLSGVLGYNLGANSYLSGLYSRRRDTFEVEALDLATPRAADENVTTRGAQLVHHRGRSQISAGYYRQEGDTLTNATYGTDPFTLSPPLSDTPTEFAPIEALAASHYRASIFTVDGSWWLTSRWRLFGRSNRTSTAGQVTAYGLGDYLDQDPDLDGVSVVLNPFDVVLRDRWIGIGYLLDKDTEVVLSHQRRSWDDRAAPSHGGSYGLWRLGARKRF